MENNHMEPGKVEVFTPYITKNGRRIYKKDGGMFHFWADDRQVKGQQSFLDCEPKDNDPNKT